MMMKSFKSVLLKCALPSWYEDFKNLTIESYIIQIPEDVFNYFKDDVFVLPKECNAQESLDIEYGDPGEDMIEEPSLLDFSEELKNNLELLDNSAFVKTNWHAPQDAIWITAGQTLKCTNFTDIYQLIKASVIFRNDFNTTDIEQKDQHIVLRKYRDIHPGTEFRCFVKEKRLIAISPRDWPEYHEHIVMENHQIISTICDMFKDSIKNKFILTDYVFDVVVSPNENYLVDFSPLHKDWTETLAFDWEFFDNYSQTGIFEGQDIMLMPEFRYLPNDPFIQPNSRNNYGIPSDIQMAYGSNFGDAVDQLLANVMQLNDNPNAASDVDASGLDELDDI